MGLLQVSDVFGGMGGILARALHPSLLNTWGLSTWITVLLPGAWFPVEDKEEDHESELFVMMPHMFSIWLKNHWRTLQI